MNRLALSLAITSALALAGCGDPRPDDVPVEVSAIGGAAEPADPSRGPLDTPHAVRLYATAQGLVRFDANGQIVAGLAERWIVTDEGRSYIFRLRDAEWADGSSVTAEQVVRVIRRAFAANSRNALARSLNVIDEVVQMTPEVIEVRLRHPRPDLLNLFAQPEMAVFRVRSLDGTGPFRIAERDRGATILVPVSDPAQIDEAEFEEPGPERHVRLRGERASLALARFVAKRSDLILGGTFRDWPLVAVAGVAPANIRFDPAEGLFGLAIVERSGFLADAENREALAMAFDRPALTGALLSSWTTADTLLPARLDSAEEPAVPTWRELTTQERRTLARARVQQWRRDHDGEPVRLRIAMPRGPGATLLWGHIGTGLIALGIDPIWVAPEADADLRLIDAVAPYDSGRWYLATACQLCSDEARAALEAAREAPTLGERSRRIAEADTVLTADVAFIPLAKPLRWSIVAARLNAWQGNPRAWHPLDQLRNESE